jgi:hypothetical protein
MNDKELYALAAEAETLATNINSRLDNPDYVFEDGEAIIEQLREVAQRCKFANFRVAARRLEQLARDVAERSK